MDGIVARVLVAMALCVAFVAVVSASPAVTAIVAAWLFLAFIAWAIVYASDDGGE